MSRKKQIEEMAKDLQKSEHWYFNDHSVDFELDRKKTAENLYNAGYRKATEVAREIFEEIEKHKQIIVEGTKPVYTLKQRELEELKKKYIKNCTNCKHIISCEPNPFGICDEHENANND